jgi:hypothetical protein
MACDGGRAPDRASYVEQAVALAPEVERATGLRFTTPPKVEVRSAEQVREFVRRALDEPGARAELEGVAAAYRHLGLLEPTADLREILVRVLGEQVVGYYDPRTKTLYLTQGADSAAVTVTLRHELVHALQDQHQNLDSLLRVRGQGDRSAGAQAALEGQATWAMFGPAGLALQAPGGWDRVRQMIRENMEQTPALAAAPLIVRETLLFPYLSGAELARAVARTGHPDSLVRRLPASTEQVLHVERYIASDGTRPDAPLVVTLPAPRTGSLRAENTMGEFETRLVLFQHLADLGTAAQAAGGWGGRSVGRDPDAAGGGVRLGQRVGHAGGRGAVLRRAGAVGTQALSGRARRELDAADHQGVRRRRGGRPPGGARARGRGAGRALGGALRRCARRRRDGPRGPRARDRRRVRRR